MNGNRDHLSRILDSRLSQMNNFSKVFRSQIACTLKDYKCYRICREN